MQFHRPGAGLPDPVTIAVALVCPLGTAFARRSTRQVFDLEDYASTIDSAVREIKAILATFAALLRIAEIEDGARRRGFQTVDLNLIAESAVSFYRPLAEEGSVSLRLEQCDGAPAYLLGDADLLSEALDNLIENAIKFTPPGSTVSVSVIRSADATVLAVTDQGPGIPAEEREKVLRRFYRGEQSYHKPGTGLGLSLVAAVAQLHRLQLLIEDVTLGCCVSLVADTAHSKRPFKN